MANNALTNLNNANVIAYMQFENLVNIFNKTQSNPNFFGNWIYPLILSGHISMELLRRIKDLMENNVLPNFPENKVLFNDYHSHMSYVYLVKDDYVQAINELNMVQDGNTLQNRILSKKSFKSLIYSVCKKYRFVANDDEFNLFVGNDLFQNEDFIYALVRLQNVVKYWNYISCSRIAYDECLNALCFFKNVLTDLNQAADPFNDKESFITAIKHMFDNING